jgi:hypothetical protein
MSERLVRNCRPAHPKKLDENSQIFQLKTTIQCTMRLPFLGKECGDQEDLVVQSWKSNIQLQSKKPSSEFILWIADH